MKPEEVLKILSVLEVNYPASFKRAEENEEAKKAIAASWYRVLKDKDYAMANKAVDYILCTNKTNFSPSVGFVRDLIIKMESGPEMTEMEAWEYVYKAIKNSAWHAQEEYQKLPPMIRKCVGSPEMLQSWSGMPIDSVQSVIQSHFVRTFRKRQELDYEYRALPDSIKDTILKLGEGIGA
jgi:uncharacterized protein (UPF0297 family)